MDLDALNRASADCSLSPDAAAEQVRRVDGLRSSVQRIERGAGTLIISFESETDVAELDRYVQLEQECGGAMFDITLEREPTPTIRYFTSHVELFAVLADLARAFDVQAEPT